MFDLLWFDGLGWWKTRWKSSSWKNLQLERKDEKGYFNNIIKELKIEDFICVLGFFVLVNESPFSSQYLHFLMKTFCTSTSPRQRLRKTENVYFVCLEIEFNRHSKYKKWNAKTIKKPSSIYLLQSAQWLYKNSLMWFDANTKNRHQTSKFGLLSQVCLTKGLLAIKQDFFLLFSFFQKSYVCWWLMHQKTDHTR